MINEFPVLIVFKVCQIKVHINIVLYFGVMSDGWDGGGLTYLKTSVHLDIDRDRDYERLYGTRPAEVLSEEREARERGDDLVLADLEADLIDSLYKGDGLWQPVREA